MKKLIISLLVVCMLSLVAVSAFASEDQWIKSIVDNGDGTATITLQNLPGDTGWTELAMFTEEKAGLSFDDLYGNKVDRGAKNAVVTTTGTIGAGDADFPCTLTDGVTYYCYLARCNGAQWDYSTAVYVYTHGEGSNDTADISVIAYAVTAIAGLGALVVAKKR